GTGSRTQTNSRPEEPNPLDPLKNPSRPHPSPDTHRQHPILQTMPLQRMYYRSCTDGTRSPQRMSQGDSASHRIHPFRVQVKLTYNRKRLRRECLVQLNPADVVQLQPA